MPETYDFQSLFEAMARRGAAPAMMRVRGGELHCVSFEALTSRARALARGLLRDGVQSGEPVALIGPNSFAWVIVRLALGLSGALAVVIDELANDAELQAILARSKARRVFANPARAAALRALDPGLKIAAFGDDLPAELADLFEKQAEHSERPLPSVAANAPSMLAYTSGTTGTAKAIVLANANIDANVRALVASGLVGPGDNVLLPLPLVHIYPYVVGLLSALGSGATVVFPESATGPHLIEAIARADVSTIVGVPRLYAAICAGVTARIRGSGHLPRVLFQRGLELSAWQRRVFRINLGPILFAAIRARFGKKLRLLVSGGARLDPETFWMLAGLGYDVKSGYGLAETASLFTANLPGRERWGSEGMAVNGAVRIAGADSTGLGEIEVKGPQVFARYLDNPEATRAAFTADGWFRTGDVGRLDREGFLSVAGRSKDTLVLGGGKKVDPEALEKLYGTSRYIREIAIFEHRGALAALVVPSLEAARQGGAIHVDTAIRVDLASTAHTLPSYQRLSGFALTQTPLPRTRLGKYRRFLLPQLYESAKRPASAGTTQQLSAEDQALLANPLARQIHELLRQRYPHVQFGLDASPLVDLGIDSFEWISFGLELEDRFHLRLSEEEIGSVVTVRDLLQLAIRAPAQSEAPAPATRDWAAPLGLPMRLMGASLFLVNRVLLRVLFRLKVEGAQHLPADGNFVLIANHASYLDAPALAASIRYRLLRNCYWASDVQLLFSRGWQRLFMRTVHGYPVDERAPAHAVAMTAGLLERGHSVVWFPEGWRSPDGNLQAFLPGIGHLLQRRPVPVVPAYIEGSFEALPRDAKVPSLRPIRVWIGDLVSPAEWQESKSGGRLSAQSLADLLHERVAMLERQAKTTPPGAVERSRGRRAS